MKLFKTKDKPTKFLASVPATSPYVAVLAILHDGCRDDQGVVHDCYPVVAWETRQDWVRYSDGGQYEYVRDPVLVVEGEVLPLSELMGQYTAGPCPCLIKVVPAEQVPGTLDELKARLEETYKKDQE